MAIAIVGIITYGIYSLFELFVRRKERMLITDRLTGLAKEGSVDMSKIDLNLGKKCSSYVALRFAGLLFGLGLGIIAGYALGMWLVPSHAPEIYDWSNQTAIQLANRTVQSVSKDRNVIMVASILIFGSAGMVTAFLVERRLAGKSKD